MSEVSVELDFFRMEKENSSNSQFHKLTEQRRTVPSIDLPSAFLQGVQTDVSKINPQLLKPVIGSGVATACSNSIVKEEPVFWPNEVLLASDNPFSVPSAPKGNQSFLSALSFFNQILRVASENSPGKTTAPLTIFYNGTVSVFDVPHDKAGTIMKLAQLGNSKTIESIDPKVAVPLPPSREEHKLLEKLSADLPIARKKSLQRFLEKRKERLTCVSLCEWVRMCGGEEASGVNLISELKEY